MTQATRYADVAGTTLVASSAYGYDQASRLTGITHSKGATTLASYTLAYDAADRVSGKTSAADGSGTFGYDDAGQLTAASNPAKSYGYDAAGNRTTAGYQTGAYNRVSADGTYAYTYDNEGNRTRRTNAATGATDEYTWDHRNRLTRVLSKTSGGAVTQDVLYTYDALDQRVRKQVDSNGDGTYETAESYAHSGGQLALAFNGAGQVQERYLYGPGVDQVLAVERGGAVQWFLGDDQGTVRDVLDAGGAVVNHLVVDPFGVVVSQTNASVPVRFVYTGREYDAETGLYQYRARYYDAAVGKFVSEDPIGFAGSDPNLYRYVGNSATNLTDPSGLRPKTPVESTYVLNDAVAYHNGQYYYGWMGDSQRLATQAEVIEAYTETMSKLPMPSGQRPALPLDGDVVVEGGLAWIVRGDIIIRNATLQEVQADYDDFIRSQAQAVISIPPVPPAESYFPGWSSDTLPGNESTAGGEGPADAWLYEAARGYEQYRRDFFDLTSGFRNPEAQAQFREVSVNYARVAPGLSDASDFYELATGRDLATGERLSWVEWGLTAVATAAPIVPAGVVRKGWNRVTGRTKRATGAGRAPVAIVAGTLEREKSHTVLGARILGGIPDKHTPHHLIGVKEANDFPVMHKAAERGYDVNRGNNLIALPNDEALSKQLNLPYHPGNGRHRVDTYVEPVRQRLGDLQRRYDAGLVNHDALIDEIMKIEDGIRKDLLDGTLRLNSRYPWYPITP